MSSRIAHKVFLDANQEPVAYDGSLLQWRVSAYALVVEDQSILIIKNKLEKLYDTVGGGIEFGENIADALTRECLEEGGVSIELGKLLDAHVGWFYHKNGTYYQTLQLFYLAQPIGELVNPTDADITWRDYVPITEIGTTYRLPSFVEKVITEQLVNFKV